MKLIVKEDDEMVRIIIGTTKHGFTGIKAPIKTIRVKETTVEEVYMKILEMIADEK